jgi:hypothetical protein
VPANLRHRRFLLIGVVTIGYPRDDSGFLPVALTAGGASALMVVLGLLLRRGPRQTRTPPGVR